MGKNTCVFQENKLSALCEPSEPQLATMGELQTLGGKLGRYIQMGGRHFPVFLKPDYHALLPPTPPFSFRFPLPLWVLSVGGGPFTPR
jgi:hypothetical protein